MNDDDALPCLRGRPCRGFSLLEVLVVLLVVGVISLVAVPAFSRVLGRANESALARTTDPLVRELDVLSRLGEPAPLATVLAEIPTVNDSAFNSGLHQNSVVVRTDDYSSIPEGWVSLERGGACRTVLAPPAVTRPTTSSCVAKTTGSEPSPNLFANSSFETGRALAQPTSWLMYRNPEIVPVVNRAVTVGGVDGANAYRLWVTNASYTATGGVANRLHLYQDIPVIAGETYTYSAWLRLPQLAGAGTGIRLEQRNTAWTTLKTVDLTAQLSGQWKRIVTRSRFPATCRRCGRR